MPCYVVRAEYSGIPRFAAARNAVRLVWIDRERGLVLRDAWEGTVNLPPYTVPIKVHELITYTTIEIDQPIADDVFAFHPPDGGRQLRTFTPPLAVISGDAAPPAGQMIPSNGLGSAIASGVAGGSGVPGVDPDGGVYRVGGGVTPPVVISKRTPDYTEQARQAKFEGTVVLYVVVGADGIPVNIQVARSLGMGLDEKAIEAVKDWRFRPGMKDGQAVPVAATIEMNFKLK